MTQQDPARVLFAVAAEGDGHTPTGLTFAGEGSHRVREQPDCEWADAHRSRPLLPVGLIERGIEQPP